MCVRLHLFLSEHTQETAGLLSRPGLFAETEHNNRNENSLSLKHLRASTLSLSFCTALC